MVCIHDHWWDWNIEEKKHDRTNLKSIHTYASYILYCFKKYNNNTIISDF